MLVLGAGQEHGPPAQIRRQPADERDVHPPIDDPPEEDQRPLQSFQLRERHRCPVRNPVAGDLNDRLHRMIPAKRRRRIAGKPEAHRGDDAAAGQEGEAEAASPPER